jgi:4-amino-4-deoxy-L-arabinose transferase-like glycosyltransferase
MGLLALLVFLFFFRLGHRELYSSHEARAAQNAQRMLDTGVWGLPVLFDGQADLQKPPGYYWLVAVCGWLNGGTVTAFEARFPATLAGLLTVLMVFGFLKAEGRPTAAWVAAISLATAIHFTAIARTARIDVPLTCAMTAALVCFYRLIADRETDKHDRTDRSFWSHCGWLAMSALAAAAGVMLKGPIALALIGPVAVAFMLWERRRLPILSMAIGTVIVLALSAPWFLWVNQATQGEFFLVFFWHHNVERFTGASPTLASNPWWFYVPRFAADFLPWTPMLILLGARGASPWSSLPLLARRAPDSLLRFALCWFTVMFVVLSSAQFKRADYLLPLYPGAAIILGCLYERQIGSLPPRWARWLFAVIAGGSLIGWQVMSFVVEPFEQAREEKLAFSELIRAQAPPPNEVMLFRTESHLLAFHLGRPLLTRVEWHDLNDWLAQPGPHFVVMPPEYVYPAHQIVRSRKLIEVARLEDYTPGKPPRPLVFLRTE